MKNFLLSMFRFRDIRSRRLPYEFMRSSPNSGEHWQQFTGVRPTLAGKFFGELLANVSHELAANESLSFLVPGDQIFAERKFRVIPSSRNTGSEEIKNSIRHSDKN